MQAQIKVSVEELPLVMRMTHLQAILDCSKTKAYEIVHTRGFPVLRIGRTIRIPRDAFLRWLEQRMGSNSDDEG